MSDEQIKADIIESIKNRLLNERKHQIHTLNKLDTSGGWTHAPIKTINEIRETTAQIRLFKRQLRDRGVIVEDLPGDDPEQEMQQSLKNLISHDTYMVSPEITDHRFNDAIAELKRILHHINTDLDHQLLIDLIELYQFRFSDIDLQGIRKLNRDEQFKMLIDLHIKNNRHNRIEILSFIKILATDIKHPELHNLAKKLYSTLTGDDIKDLEESIRFLKERLQVIRSTPVSFLIEIKPNQKSSNRSSHGSISSQRYRLRVGVTRHRSYFELLYPNDDSDSCDLSPEEIKAIVGRLCQHDRLPIWALSSPDNFWVEIFLRIDHIIQVNDWQLHEWLYETKAPFDIEETPYINYLHTSYPIVVRMITNTRNSFYKELWSKKWRYFKDWLDDSDEAATPAPRFVYMAEGHPHWIQPDDWARPHLIGIIRPEPIDTTQALTKDHWLIQAMSAGMPVVVWPLQKIEHPGYTSYLEGICTADLAILRNLPHALWKARKNGSAAFLANLVLFWDAGDRTFPEEKLTLSEENPRG